MDRKGKTRERVIKEERIRYDLDYIDLIIRPGGLERL